MEGPQAHTKYEWGGGYGSHPTYIGRLGPQRSWKTHGVAPQEREMIGLAMRECRLCIFRKTTMQMVSTRQREMLNSQ